MVIPFALTPFNLADLKAILNLEQDVFPEDTYGMVEFLSLYVRGKDTFIVARAGKKVVGYIIAYVEDYTGYVASIAVDPETRGQGLGRLLMETEMARLFEHGAEKIGLHVREDNVAAIHLYESLGFVTQETVAHYYEGGASALYMERETSSP
ncbi:MAG: ribosomal protein S18-alanine N-acetyltransferase [Chloroflexota bacterium]